MVHEAKTKPQHADVAAHFAAFSVDALKQDGIELAGLFEAATGEPPVMWGTSIIGFGRYDYTYPSGHSGQSAKVGFALRKTGPVIYLCPGFEALGDELAKIGPHKTGKGCLYLKNLKGIDRKVLSAMIRASVAEIDRLYPPS